MLFNRYHLVQSYLPLTNFLTSFLGIFTLQRVWTGWRGMTDHQKVKPYFRILDSLSNLLSRGINANAEANFKKIKMKKIQKIQKSDQPQQEAEEDEFNPTLAAMESEIKPKVLKTVKSLTKEYNKLIRYQKEKLDCVLKSETFSSDKRKKL